MEHYQVKPITSFEQCASYVRCLSENSLFSDPMLSGDEQLRHNLTDAIGKPDTHNVIGIYKGDVLSGIFSFLTLREEQYLEMLVGLSDDAAVYEAMLHYLSREYAGLHADFIFNPNNHLLTSALRKRGAAFEVEQQKMIWVGPVLRTDVSGVEVLTEKHIPAYLSMHSKDMYWTGDKVLQAPERFRVLVAVEDGQMVGYLDITHCFDENEPYDLLVKESFRRRGHGRRLIAAALEMNHPKAMNLLVDIDNHVAIRLFSSLGFRKAENQNVATAHVNL